MSNAYIVNFPLATTATTCSSLTTTSNQTPTFDWFGSSVGVYHGINGIINSPHYSLGSTFKIDQLSFDNFIGEPFVPPPQKISIVIDKDAKISGSRDFLIALHEALTEALNHKVGTARFQKSLAIYQIEVEEAAL